MSELFITPYVGEQKSLAAPCSRWSIHSWCRNRFCRYSAIMAQMTVEILSKRNLKLTGHRPRAEILPRTMLCRKIACLIAISEAPVHVNPRHEPTLLATSQLLRDFDMPSVFVLKTIMSIDDKSSKQGLCLFRPTAEHTKSHSRRRMCVRIWAPRDRPAL